MTGAQADISADNRAIKTIFLIMGDLAFQSGVRHCVQKKTKIPPYDIFLKKYPPFIKSQENIFFVKKPSGKHSIFMIPETPWPEVCRTEVAGHDGLWLFPYLSLVISLEYAK